MTDDQVLMLHRELVQIPSVSHHEEKIADFVQAFLTPFATRIERWGDNVVAWTGRGKRLLMNSHLDTVPAGLGWTKEPWQATVEEGKVFGLGANDTKASVAAMMSAFAALGQQRGACELVLMLVPEEETGGKGTEMAWPKLRDELGWVPDGVVVGEPTELMIGTDQKGMMVLELTAEGQACHAANAKSMGITNPVWQLAEDLRRLRAFDLGPPHPELGPTTLEPTLLFGSSASNQIAQEAKAVLDLRTLPGSRHADLHAAMQEAVTGTLHMRSIRLEPYQCPRGSAIVAAALAARPISKTFASATMSDQVFFQGAPAIKCGPGVSARSHTLDEYVLESEIVAGYHFYRTLIDTFAAVHA